MFFFCQSAAYVANLLAVTCY